MIATAIKANLTIYDLQEIEVAYAPPYNSAKDPVNIFGYVAENMLNDEVRFINYDQLDDYLVHEKTKLIDVKTKTEFESGAIPDATNMDTLRDNLDFFDKNKKYQIYCQID